MLTSSHESDTCATCGHLRYVHHRMPADHPFVLETTEQRGRISAALNADPAEAGWIDRLKEALQPQRSGCPGSQAAEQSYTHIVRDSGQSYTHAPRVRR